MSLRNLQGLWGWYEPFVLMQLDCLCGPLRWIELDTLVTSTMSNDWSSNLEPVVVVWLNSNP